jgi:hypothetical protein
MLKLFKKLYRLKQSTLNWYSIYYKYLISFGYILSEVKQSILFKVMIIIIVWVNAMLLIEP